MIHSQTTNWWWIRHAPTGLKGRMIGHTDVDAILPCLETLKKISKELPEKADWLISTLSRCQQTAEALRGSHQLSVHSSETIQELKEQNFGDWENVSYDDPQVRNAMAFWEAPATISPPNGESFADVIERVRTVIDVQHSSQNTSENIVIIAHAGIIRAAVAIALDLSPAQALRLQVDPLSITRTSCFKSQDVPDGSWSMQTMNRSFLSNED